MLDTEANLCHFSRKSFDIKPYQTLSISNGVLSDDLHAETDVVNEETGQRMPGFKFQFMTKNGKKKGKQLTVVPEQPEQIDMMVNSFRKGMKGNRDATSMMLKQSSIKVE